HLAPAPEARRRRAAAAPAQDGARPRLHARAAGDRRAVRAGGLVVKIYLYSVLTLVVTSGVLFVFATAATTERRRDRILISEHIVVDMAQRRHEPEILRGDVVRLKQAERIK